VALIDVIKCDVLDNNDWLVWKTPITDLRLGTQLIVNNNQRAVLVKGGKVCDYFEAGTHTLSTNNIPILNKIVNLPFGGKTPFSAEVWYFNLSDKRNQKWGTQSPIDVMDPTLGFPFSLRSYGDWGYRLTDPSALYNRLIGTIEQFNAESLDEQFKGLIIQQFTSISNRFLMERNISVYNISAYLNELAKSVRDELLDEFMEYGIEITNFNIRSINFPQDNKDDIREIMKEKMRVNELSKVHASETYKSVRSLNVMENISNNQGELGGNLTGALGIGAGLGLGANLGNQMAAQMNQASQSNPQQSDSIEDKLLKLKRLLDMGMINQNDFESKKQLLLNEFLGI
jgi:membrane protease subunit (stomatin/prohibitin family)